MPEETYKDKDPRLNQGQCTQCGKPTQLQRINSSYIKQEVGNVLLLEKGLFYTIRELFIRPGKSIREFIFEDRSKLVKPVYFLIVTSLIYTLANHFLKFEDGYISGGDFDGSTIGVIINWLQNNYGAANLILSIFIALWLKLFFRRHDYNFFEILILLCYVMGAAMLIFAMFGIIEGLTSVKVMQMGAIIVFIYITWALGKFYHQRFSGYLKAFFVYLLGYVSFLTTAVFVGLAI